MFRQAGQSGIDEVVSHLLKLVWSDSEASVQRKVEAIDCRSWQSAGKLIKNGRNKPIEFCTRVNLARECLDQRVFDRIILRS